MSEFTIKKATRTGIIPLIVYYAESGCGKTYTALLTARGIAGPNGKIVVIDTESGRASLYADLPIFGGYDVLQLDAPFSPARYVSALEAAKEFGASVVVVDSGSHEWEGVSGVLDMAAANEQESRRPGLHNWKTPKFEHAKFVAALIRSSIPVIVCLRAKYKTRQGKENGKTVIIKDDHTSPIQADDFIFEATVHGEIMPDHSLRLTKWSHPDLKDCFPDGKPVELKHGEKIAAWCAAGTTQKPAADLEKAKGELWKLLKPVRGDAKSWDVARQWLVDEAILDPSIPIQDLTSEQLTGITRNASAKISKLQPA